MIMMEKEMERRNFLNWYCLYATTEEIEKAKRINKKALERLINEYSDELALVRLALRPAQAWSRPGSGPGIEKINNLRHLPARQRGCVTMSF